MRNFQDTFETRKRSFDITFNERSASSGLWKQ